MSLSPSRHPWLSLPRSARECRLARSACLRGRGAGPKTQGVEAGIPSPSAGTRRKGVGLGEKVLLTLLISALFAPSALAQQAPDDAEIRRAIDKGVAYLRETQDPSGRWNFSFNHDHALGITALAGLALMENGVDRDDPAIVKADRVVRSLVARSDQTYDVTLAILFLARRMPGSRGEDDDLIRDLGARLAAGQGNGMWSYNLPMGSGSGSGSGSGAGRKRRNGGTIGGPGDNSNTQFALLGIWTATRHGFAGNDALAAIDEHFRSTQNPDGRWSYGASGPGADAMTCAGLMGLAISAARPEKAEKQTARARGAVLAADPAFVKGLAAVSADARRLDAGSDIYYLWSIERVCVALGQKKLDGFDWYAKGARELLGRQQADGSWPQGRWVPCPTRASPCCSSARRTWRSSSTAS